MDMTQTRLDIGQLRLENARLLHDNTQLKHELEHLKKKLEQLTEGDNDKLRRLEESKRQLDHDLRQVKESRGKVFRGLNMQTEIAMVQCKRDIDNMKKQLLHKDDIIAHQESKISSLTEEVCTLRTGLQALTSLPKRDTSDSEPELDEEDLLKEMASKRSSQRTGVVINGHSNAGNSNSVALPNHGTRGQPGSVNPDLLQMISQLDSGTFQSS